MADSLSEGIDIGEWSREKSFLLFAFVKSYRTTNSILLLCEHGNGQDAFMLVRTLFELMVITGYIFKTDTKNRIELYTQNDWVLRDKMIKNINDKTIVLKASLKQGNEFDIDEITTKAKSHRKSYNKGDCKTSWSKKHISEMAKEIGVEELYKSIYMLGTILTHSLSRAGNEYLRDDNGGIELLTYPSDNYIGESLVGTYFCFYHILQQLDETLNLGISDKLKDLDLQYSDCFKKQS